MCWCIPDSFGDQRHLEPIHEALPEDSSSYMGKNSNFIAF